MSVSTAVTKPPRTSRVSTLALPRDRILGWLALFGVAALPLAESLRILVQRGNVTVDGDIALMQLGAQRAWHLDQVLGPYSRDGFHHLGPAVFYLLAPFVRALEPSSTGLYLGSILISGAALVATVAVLWRRTGAPVALWSAVAINVFCLCVRVGTFREPWNPYSVIAPMLLFAVLWAVGITGMRGAPVWALVVGSFEVQTHLATGVFVVVMSALLVLWLAIAAWRRGDRAITLRRFSHPGCITGTAALALIWIPSVVELFQDHPNNVQALWDFFTTPHQGPGLHGVLRAVVSAVTIVPFGNQDYLLTLNRSYGEAAVGALLLAAALLIAVWRGWKRNQPLALALAATSVAGAVLGTISLSQTAGPAYFYFAVWMAFVPVSLLLAIGVALLAPGASDVPHAPTALVDQRRQSNRLIAGCVVAAIALAALTVRSDLRMGPVRTIASATAHDTSALATAAESVLRPTDHRVGITVATSYVWPEVAGMIADLDTHGVQSTVAPRSMALLFEPKQTSDRAVDVRYYLYASADAEGRRAARGKILFSRDGYVLTFQRLAPAA